VNVAHAEKIEKELAAMIERRVIDTDAA